MTSEATKQYNQLPYETRSIANRVYTEMQINQLRIDRDKIVKHHRALLRDIDQHIKSLEDWLIEQSHSPALPVADESL